MILKKRALRKFCLQADVALLALAALFVSATLPQTAEAQSTTIAATPPMGWNSWNKFGCNVSDKLIREMADAIVSAGMKDAGYRFGKLADCWQVSRAADGSIVVDPERFPNGMKPLADYVHSKDLKFGEYTNAGRMTCAKRAGSYDQEEQDINTYSDWGVDYVIID